MATITAAHVWYVSQIHPESLGDAELQALFNARVLKDSDRAYWALAAQILNSVALSTGTEAPINPDLSSQEFPSGRGRRRR